MKKTQKILGILTIALLGIIASATTACAAVIGDGYSVYGIGLGWFLIGAVIVIAIGAWAMQVTKKVIKPFVPILVIVFIAGLCLQGIEVAEEPASITPDVTWSVSAVCGTDDVTVDDDARTITALVWADVDLEVINGTDDAAWVTITDDPLINFTVSPSMAEGISTTTQQATTRCRVNNPDKTFTEDSTSYDLFADASGGEYKDLKWTADGTDEYEDRLCTVTLGSSETVQLQIIWLDDGLSQCEAGETEVFTISIGGVTYTMTIIISALT